MTQKLPNRVQRDTVRTLSVRTLLLGVLSWCLRVGSYSLCLPSDTKLLLTKNYSEIIIFEKITNFTRNFPKKSFFPGDLESAKSLKNYEK